MLLWKEQGQMTLLKDVYKYGWKYSQSFVGVLFVYRAFLFFYCVFAYEWCVRGKVVLKCRTETSQALGL